MSRAPNDSAAVSPGALPASLFSLCMSASAILDARRPVFLITHEFYPKRGGIATFTEEIARASATLGYNIEVWAQSASPATEKIDWPFRLRRMPLKGSHDLACQIQLARELIRHRRDLRDAQLDGARARQGDRRAKRKHRIQHRSDMTRESG